MTTANKLTILRIILVPVFLGVLYAGFPGSNIWALIIFIVASLTDLLDGYIARHYNQITNFGKFMDPLADKILVMSAMCWFVEAHQMPGWALAIVLLREFAVSGMRLVAVEQGKVIAAAWSGKVKTASTMVCLCLMMLNIPEWLNTLCVIVIVATTVYSGIEYFIKNAEVFKNAD
jgi:CDP-diacylglycerol--glycerol-3-phosphate 3-phosphatidyltransferase